MLGLLSNDEGKSFEDGLIPIGLEMDDHVRYLGEVEFNAVEGLTRARKLLGGNIIYWPREECIRRQ